MLIIELAQKRYINLIGSDILIKEISEIKNIYKRKILDSVLSLCSDVIEVTPDIIDRSIEIRNYTNIRTKDSIHLACGEKSKVDCFLTTDKKFMNNANRFVTDFRVMNPSDWIREEFI